MKITKGEIKKSTVELAIEVNNEDCQPFLEKSAKRLAKTVKVEGFRPGMAPYEIIKQKVGEMSIYQEALDEIITYFYWQAVKQENLDTVGQPKIELEKMAPGNPITFKAIVSLMPEVKLGDYKKVKVERQEIKVEQAEVEKTLKDLSKMQVKEALVERPAKNGDRVEVDFTVSLNKVVIEGGQGNKYPLVLGDNTMIPGFEEQIVGMNKDEEKTFNLKFPEKYQNKTVAGKECEFKVKLLSVYEQTLPELNDDWAKGLGATSLEDLKNKITDNLKHEKEFKEDQRLEMELLSKVVEQTKFSEIPESLIESEAHRMVHEFADSITQQGLPFADYLKSIKKEEKELQADFMPKAEERVKTSIVLKEIADAEKVGATKEDLDKEVERILPQIKGNPEAEANVASEGYRHYLATIIRNKKVIDMLKEQVK